MSAAVDSIIAHTLGIDPERVTDALHYQSIPQWDSLGHVSLMVALEAAYGVTVDDDLTLALRSVPAIREFARLGRVSNASSPDDEGATVHRGLDGVTFDETTITSIDARSGELEYRGYSIHTLAARASFEEVAYLLLYGTLPDGERLASFRAQLGAARVLPEPVLAIAHSLADAHPVDVLRTCASGLGAVTSAGRGRESLEQARAAGIALIARVPMIVAAHHAYRSGREPIAVPTDVPFTEAFLTALLGEQPNPTAVRLVDKGFVVHADHSSNASAFVARIAIGTQATMVEAITAAIATFAGPLHGGAAERVTTLINAVGAPENAGTYVDKLLSRGEPVMGFGHRVYRTEDPRMRHLRASVVELSDIRGDTHDLDVLDAVAAAMRPRSRHGVAPNVDLYAGLSYRLLGLADDLAVPMFVIGRMAGWVAQALEQHANNVLIRPLLSYVGPRRRSYPTSESCGG